MKFEQRMKKIEGRIRWKGMTEKTWDWVMMPEDIAWKGIEV